ncbi:SGNH/GDSL hydrolase family protein [Arthrobacter sp. AQ5-06]|nr:SGNH/GDSL hydrolase family protein [Arthrobacter sp. AQ5-06]
MVMAIGLAAVPAEAAPPPPHVDLVAVGDSYTAGTGAGDFTSPFPCIQTVGGYVDIVARQPSVNLVDNAACHGALLTLPAQPGDVPSVLDQVAGLAASEALSGRTELVTMTAGANDVGVNTALYTCATSSYFNCLDAVRSATKSLYEVKGNLTAAFAAIHQAAPRAKIAILGYPRLFDPAGYPVMTAENTALVNYGTLALNVAIGEAVNTANSVYRANAQFIDITARFAGHEANTASSWIVFDPTDPFAPQSFHPNLQGHEQYAAALVEAVRLPELARR